MPGNFSHRDRPRLITTKFRAPSGAGAMVTRDRLLEHMQAQRQKRVTLIHAPAGFGKTTLLVQWRARLLAAGANVAWLSLSREDNALDRFLTYLIEAVRLGDPALDVDVAMLLESDPENASLAVVTELINALADAAHDFYLMLDDWHLIVDRHVRDVLNLLIKHAPAGTHVVIASRKRSSLQLARLHVAGEICEIDASDLRFTFSESEAFLCDLNALKLDSAGVQSLWSSTEGWVAALQLASLSLRNRAGASDADERPGGDLPEWATSGFRGDHYALGEYLAENVLDQLPADVLDFLLATSILDRLCADLCAAVSGQAGSQYMLEFLEKQGLFIRPLDEHRQWYRYHHLFAAHLQRRLQHQFPERKVQLHRAASAWFEVNADTDEAVTHALAVGDTARAIGLVERDAMRLVQYSAMSTLRMLVLRLPPDQLRERPELQLAIAWAHCLTHRPAQARESLALVRTSLDRNPVRGEGSDQKATETLAEVRVVEGCIRIYQDEFGGVEELVRPCVAPDAPYRPWVVAVASNVFSYVLLHREAYNAAITLQALTEPFHERTEGPFSAVYGQCFAGIAARELGHLSEAAAVFRNANELATQRIGRHSHAARLAGALLGELLVEMNKLDEAQRLLQDSRALGIEGGVVDFFIATYVGLSRLFAAFGNPAATNDVLDEGDRACDHLSFARLRAAIAGERIRHALAQQDLETARHWLKQVSAPRGSERSATWGAALPPPAFESSLLAEGRVLLASGRAVQARLVLEPVLNAAVKSGRVLLEVRTRVLMSLALDGAGRVDEALDMAAMALRVGLGLGMRRSFLDEGARFIEITRIVRARVSGKHAPDASWSAALVAFDEIGVPERTATGAVQLDAPESEEGASRPAPAVGNLKHRELDILHLLAHGRSNKEIARELNVSVDTVKWYLKIIYGKLGVNKRAEAVGAARELGALGEHA